MKPYFAGRRRGGGEGGGGEVEGWGDQRNGGGRKEKREGKRERTGGRKGERRSTIMIVSLSNQQPHFSTFNTTPPDYSLSHTIGAPLKQNTCLSLYPTIKQKQVKKSTFPGPHTASVAVPILPWNEASSHPYVTTLAFPLPLSPAPSHSQWSLG